MLLAVNGCGQQAPQTPAETATGVSGQASGMVRGRYTMIIRQEEGQELRQEYEVIADGDRRTRINYFGEPERDSEKRTDGNWMVWDGRVLLDYNPDGEPAYTRIENLDGGPPPIYVFREGSERFTQACPDARRLGTHTLLGRTAVRYACAASTVDGAVQETHEMSLDQATGLLLKDSAATYTVVASEIEPNATVDADTFSTDVPAGVEDASHPKLEEFRLPRVGGGWLALADYRPPLVIVAGDAAGIRKMLARLLPLTQGGVKPQVIGMLIAIPPADWKGSLLNPSDAASFAEATSKAAGRFPVPVAIDIKGAAGHQITEAAGVEAGQSNPTAVGFLASDGTLAHVRTDAVTEDEMGELINTLR